MNLGEKLSKLREDRGVSLAIIEKETGITGSYYNRLENNLLKNPSIEKLKRLADYFNISVAELITGDDGWKELLPPEIREFVEKENIQYLNVIRKAKNEDITPEQIEDLINAIKPVIDKHNKQN